MTKLEKELNKTANTLEQDILEKHNVPWNYNPQPIPKLNKNQPQPEHQTPTTQQPQLFLSQQTQTTSVIASSALMTASPFKPVAPMRNSSARNRSSSSAQEAPQAPTQSVNITFPPPSAPTGASLKLDTTQKATLEDEWINLATSTKELPAIQTDMTLYLQSILAVHVYIAESDRENIPKLLKRVKRGSNLIAMIVKNIIDILAAYQSSFGAQSLLSYLNNSALPLRMFFFPLCKIWHEKDQQAKDLVANIESAEKFATFEETLKNIEFNIEQHVPTLC